LTEQVRTSVLPVLKVVKPIIHPSRLLPPKRNFAIKFPRFFGLPKIHKPRLAIRPIFSVTRWYCTNAGRYVNLFLEEIMEILYQNVPPRDFSVYQSSENLIHDLNALRPCFKASVTLIMTAEFENLYSNLPRAMITAAVEDLSARFLNYRPDQVVALVKLVTYVFENCMCSI
jgi:hypothetical protein